MQQFWMFLGNSHSEFIPSAPLLLSPPSKLKTLKLSWIPPFPSFHECLHVYSACWILCDPMDCSLPGSPVHGISKARILEWVAISSSRGSSRARDRNCISCIAGRFFTTASLGKPIIPMAIAISYTCNFFPPFSSFINLFIKYLLSILLDSGNSSENMMDQLKKKKKTLPLWSLPR